MPSLDEGGPPFAQAESIVGGGSCARTCNYLALTRVEHCCKVVGIQERCQLGHLVSRNGQELGSFAGLYLVKIEQNVNSVPLNGSRKLLKSKLVNLHCFNGGDFISMIPGVAVAAKSDQVSGVVGAAILDFHDVVNIQGSYVSARGN